MVGLDEAHAAHVGRKVEAPFHARDRLLARVREAQVEVEELVAELLLRHVLILLPVDGAHVVAFRLEAAGEVRADEAARAGDDDLGALGEVLGEARPLIGGSTMATAE